MSNSNRPNHIAHPDARIFSTRELDDHSGRVCAGESARADLWQSACSDALDQVCALRVMLDETRLDLGDEILHLRAELDAARAPKPSEVDANAVALHQFALYHLPIGRTVILLRSHEFRVGGVVYVIPHGSVGEVSARAGRDPLSHGPGVYGVCIHFEADQIPGWPDDSARHVYPMVCLGDLALHDRPPTYTVTNEVKINADGFPDTPTLAAAIDAAAREATESARCIECGRFECPDPDGFSCVPNGPDPHTQNCADESAPPQDNISMMADSIMDLTPQQAALRLACPAIEVLQGKHEGGN